MKDQEIISRINKLIENFSFQELSDKDKDFVLSNISESEYIEIRLTMQKSKTFFENQTPIYPDEKILLNLHDELEDETVIRKIINYQIPFYKVAAAIAVIVSFMFLLLSQQNSIDQNQIALLDTVFIEKYDTLILTDYDTIEVVRTIYVYKEKKDKVNKVTHSSTDYQMEKSYPAIMSSRSINPKDINRILEYSKSNTIKQDQELASFIVGMN